MSYSGKKLQRCHCQKKAAITSFISTTFRGHFCLGANDIARNRSRVIFFFAEYCALHFYPVNVRILRRDDFLRTKLSSMHRLPNFLTRGAPLRALRARESSAINSS